MSVVTVMMPNDRQILPAISQHRSISLRDNSTSGRSHSNRQAGESSIAAPVQRPSGDSSFSVPRTESSEQSSSRSDSSVSETSKTRSRRSSSQFPTNARTDTGNGFYQPQSLVLLPRLLDDQSLVRAARKTSKEHSALSSRSLEILPSRDFISDELRMRTVSLPILGHRQKHRPRMLHDTEEEGEYLTDSYSSDTDDPSGDESNIVEIGPYPNVGVDSYLDSHLLPEFLPAYLKPWTPGVRKSKSKRNRNNTEAEKKKKDIEALQAKARKRNSQSKSNPRRRSVRSNAFTRKREQEVAKRHPVRKQFVYSELVEDEFQKHIPKRLPGGKLKPIYNRRTTEGEIYVPDNLDIAFERLSVKPGDEKLNSFDTPAAINRRRKEELQTLLEKRKKLQRQMVNKKKRKVRFVLPEEKGGIEVTRAKVITEGIVPAGSGSISQSLDGSELEEDTTTEHGKPMEGEQGDASAEQPGNPTLSEVVDSDILYDGNEDRIKRTNSWVAAQLAEESLEGETESRTKTDANQQPGTGTDANQSSTETDANHSRTETDANQPRTETDANHNSLQTQHEILSENQSTNVSKDISHEVSPDNSPTSKTVGLRVDDEPLLRTNEIIQSTNSAPCVGDIVNLPGGSVSHADTQPGVQSKVGSYSLLRTVEPPPKESVETSRETKLLLERIPSIIISDT